MAGENDRNDFGATKMRQRFGPDEDYLLVLQVKTDAPYKARHGAIGETWDGVAERLNQDPDFQMRPIKGSTAKTRFDTLVYRHRQWMKNATVENFKETDTPYRKILSELLQEVKDNARLCGENGGQQDEEISTEARTSVRLGKRRASTSSNTIEVEPPARRETFMLPRARGTEEIPVLPGASSFPAAEVTLQNTEPIEEPILPSSPIVGDVVTVQHAMAELVKMQHAFATRPNEIRAIELEKINDARLREEEEKTKQRGLELEIEMQRTRRRQLELEFEKEERKKDREEQAKLIASLVKQLEPKRD